MFEGYTYTLKSKTAIENNYKTIATIAPNQTNYTLANTNTAAITEYILEATDACGTVLTPSDRTGNLVLTTSGGNEQVTIAWQSVAGAFQKYELYRSGTLLRTLSGATQNYTDTNVSCGQQYCYQVKGIATDGKTVSTSAQSCITVTSTATPPAATLHTTFNQQNEVEITLQLPNGQSIKSATYQRSLNGAAYKDFVKTQQTLVTDKLSTLSSVCYRANYTNPCDKTAADSQPSCPVILTAKLNPDETARLTWTSYTGFTDGAPKYELQVLDENYTVTRTIPVQGNSHTEKLTDQTGQVFRYRIKATSASGVETYSNTETLKLELALFIPSAFTPNGDGLNDVFEVKGKRFDTFRMRVFSSSGQVVYTSDDRTKSWDGTYKGAPQPEGTYAYEVTVTLQDGTTKRRTGTVTLLR